MKRVSLLFLVLLIGFGCTRKGPGDEVDPRDQYVGIYDVVFSSSTTIGPFPGGEDKGTGTITVSKGDASNELRMQITFPPIDENNVATMSGTKFTLSKSRETLIIGGKSYDAEYAASGQFSDNGQDITITSITKVQEGGVTATRTGTFSGPKRR